MYLTGNRKVYLIHRKDKLLPPIPGALIEITVKWGEIYIRAFPFQKE